MRGHVTKKRDRWFVVVEMPRTADGKRQRKWSGPFRTKKDAVASLHTTLHRRSEGSFVESSKVTFGAYFDRWFEGARGNLRYSTAHSYSRVFELYVRPALGHVRLQEVAVSDLAALYGRLEAEGGRNGARLSRTTVSHAHIVVRRCLQAAMMEGLLLRNVATLVESAPKQPSPGKRLHSVWTGEQLANFIRATAEDRHAALWRLYAVTGCRRGEALAARWSDFDLDAGRWELKRTRSSVAGRITEGEPKAGRGRVIALDPADVAVLRAHRRRQAAEKLSIGAAYNDEDYVFAGPDGQPLSPDRITRTFANLTAKAGLPRIRLHDVRHSVATALLRAGVPVKVVSERLGHASSAFTMDVYASVLPDMQADAAAAMAAIVDGRGA